MKQFETIAIRTQSMRSQYREHSTPIHLTSSFVFDDAEQARAMFADEMEGNIYSRFTNPNCNELEQKMAALEGMDSAYAAASGMAAIYVSIVSVLSQGDHILVCRSIFGNSIKVFNDILPRFGIEVTYVDIERPETWEQYIKPNTRMMFAETPSNPVLHLLDLDWFAQLGMRHNLITNIDNCMATPYLQQPAKYGIDVITHSATKYIDGQGRVLGGVVVGSNEYINKVRQFTRPTGPCLSPFNAWVLSKSLETLSLRMEKHSANALQLAEFLSQSNKIKNLHYPHLKSHPQFELAKKQMRYGGGLLSFEIEGGVEAGRSFLDKLEMISLTSNLGDTRTIATHPASTTHSRLSDEERQLVGINSGLIRISVGLEHISDIIADIEQALSSIASPL